MYAYKAEENEFVLQLLHIVHTIIQFGFYSDQEKLMKLIDDLITLMDGSLDIIRKEDALKASRTLTLTN